MAAIIRPFAAALLLVGAAATAQGTAAPALFVAELVAPAPEARFIAGGVMWRCEGTRCLAPHSNSRPLRVCSDLRREAGAVASFASGEQALAEDQLARCNG